MQTPQPDYFAAYRNLKLSRDDNGVLVAEFHSDGGQFIMTAQSHTEFVDAFQRIGQDRANKIVIITGAGGNFIGDVEWPSFGDVADPGVWSRIHDEGVQVLENIANIRVPVIAAVEGRAHIHSDYALLASVIVAAEGATFQDVGHFAVGVTPGDGDFYDMELSGWTRSSRGVPAQSTAAAGAYRIRMGSRCRGRIERQGGGARSGTGRFVPAGSGSDAPEYAHSLHSTVEGTHRPRSWLRTIPRRSVVGRPGKIKAIEGLGSGTPLAVVERRAGKASHRRKPVVAAQRQLYVVRHSGVQNSSRPCENSATRYVAPKFRGLRPRRAKKIARIGSLHDPTEPTHRVFARSARFLHHDLASTASMG